VETVALLSNNNAKWKDYVEIGVDAEDYYRIKFAEFDLSSWLHRLLPESSIETSGVLCFSASVYLRTCSLAQVMTASRLLLD
jgi:hypothetical protein